MNSDGLVHYWPFTPFNTNDILGFNDLIQESSILLTKDRNGIEYSALDLNSGFIRISEDVYFNSSFTISVWVYPSRVGLNARVIDFGNGQNNDNVLLSFSDDYSLMPYFECFNQSSDSKIRTSSTITLASDKWSFLAATYNGTQGNIYINGIKTGISNNSFFLPRNIVRKSNYIGKSNWVRDSYSYSKIDDLRIYNRYLDDSEINHLMKL